ncbi:hypothetical protein BDQ12DRAFT_598841 [Crucibulum laeve]|uniref:F-box domain-containing protein n=1 Tax=Crucibulum laeve TaxID=68775 RepID=A0A5C3M9I5_9AGAR|nr:hypothetical protein BDQ12DRAFT_598841 [Crucibulum laeve]
MALKVRGILQSPQIKHITAAFSSSPVYTAVFSYLSSPDLIRSGRTCRTLYRASSDFCSRAYNIYRHLSWFFTDPLAFRSLQAQTGTLISGSNALQFLDRTFYSESDLDLFTFHDATPEVANYLQREGYHFVKEGDQPSTFKAAFDLIVPPDNADIRGIRPFDKYRFSGVSGVFNFLKDNGQKVQVVSTTTSPLHCILCFHSTCVMNFITFEGAYSLYPKATFDARIGITQGWITERETTAIGKYALRGWRILIGTWPHQEELINAIFAFSTLRYVGDKYCWIVPFDTTNVKLRVPHTASTPPFTSDPAMFNSWTLENESYIETETRFMPVRSTLLRYKYLTADNGFLITLYSFFKMQGTFEHTKVEGMSVEEKAKAWTW